jgi:hypothetical protein
VIFMVVLNLGFKGFRETGFKLSAVCVCVCERERERERES